MRQGQEKEGRFKFLKLNLLVVYLSLGTKNASSPDPAILLVLNTFKLCKTFKNCLAHKCFKFLCFVLAS